ncbi:MAG: chemotaxis protein CheA [candidate division WOR-3 bacterium]
MKEEFKEYIKLFKEETSEYLEKLTKIMVELEKNPKNENLVEEAYRIFHTLKGMAASIGYNEIETISHNLEEKLELFKGKEKLPTEIIDEIFRGMDKIENFLLTIDSPILNKTEEKEGPFLEILFKEDIDLPAARAAVIIQRIEEKTEIEETIPSYNEIKAGKIGRILKVRCKDPEKVIDIVASFSEVEEVKLREKKEIEKIPKGEIEGIRVNVNTLDRMQNLIGELLVSSSQISEIVRGLEEESFQEIVDLHNRSIKELKEIVTSLRLVPLSLIFNKIPRYVRDLSKKLGKEVEIEIFGSEIEVDRSLLESIGDPMIHLIRNAIYHGIELPEEREALGKSRVGKITLLSRNIKGNLLLQISDDGKGIDEEEVLLTALRKGLIKEEELEKISKPEILRFLFLPGFTTKEEADKISGRGIGLDVVRKMVRSMGGSVNIYTEKNKGTTISIKLPLSMAVIKVYLIGVDELMVGLPMTFVDETITISKDSISKIMGKELILHRKEILPVYRISQMLNCGPSTNGSSQLPCVIIEIENERFAIVGGVFRGSMEAVVKPLPPPLDKIKEYLGITMMGNGKPCLILDLPTLRYRRDYENTGS